MKMGTVGSYNMLMNFYKMLHCHGPKDSAVCSDCHKNLESHKAGHIGFLAFTMGESHVLGDSLLNFDTVQYR
jgi:hypothetical protein